METRVCSWPSLALLAGIGLQQRWGWWPMRSVPWRRAGHRLARLGTLAEAREHHDQGDGHHTG
jgi:hypothetical protein